VEFDFSILIHALPFFLLGLSGMLQSKMDLYSVAYFLSDKEVGSYQVIINLFIYIQTFSYVILIPFVKNVYRLPLEKVRKISKMLFIIGIVITVPASVLIYLILTILYKINISIFFLIWGVLFALPIFYYLPKIYTLFKNEFQNKVVLINIYGLISNLLLNIILILNFGMIGAIAASATAQIIMLFCYILYEKKLLSYAKIQLSNS
jgi:O-antigen/teichoic acid export membrane protein